MHIVTCLKGSFIVPQIEDLNLDNCKSASVVGLSEEWSSLQSLSLINVGLTSLKVGFQFTLSCLQ